jgi:hypothetical protein
MASIHLCKSPGCTIPVGVGHFLCAHHWALLPSRVQRGIMERANGWRSQEAAVDFLRGYQRGAGILKGGTL